MGINFGNSFGWWVHFCPEQHRWVVDSFEEYDYVPPVNVDERVTLLDAACIPGEEVRIPGVGIVLDMSDDFNWPRSYMFFEKGAPDDNRG